MTIPGLDTRPPLADALALLHACGLPTDDLAEATASGRIRFLGVRRGGELVATVALETLDPHTTLLRSVAVAPAYRSQGLARDLVAFAEQLAYSKDSEHLYLLTDRAQEFFADIGYTIAPRQSAPGVVRHCAEFSQLCPDSASLMYKALHTPPGQAMAYRPPGPLMSHF